MRRYACNLMVSNGMYERVLNTIVVHYKSFNSRRRCCRYCRPFRVAATQFRFIILVSPASHTHDQLFVEHKLIFSFRKIKNLLFFQQLPTHTNHQWVRVRVCVSVKYRTQQKSHLNSPRVFTVSFFFFCFFLSKCLCWPRRRMCAACAFESISLWLLSTEIRNVWEERRTTQNEFQSQKAHHEQSRYLYVFLFASFFRIFLCDYNDDTMDRLFSSHTFETATWLNGWILYQSS